MKPGKIKKEIRERYLGKKKKKKRELEGDKQRQFFREEKKIIGAETKKKKGPLLPHSLSLSLSLSLSPSPLSLPFPEMVTQRESLSGPSWTPWSTILNQIFGDNDL